LIQGFFLEEALGERIGLSDGEWALTGPLLPAERGRGCRPAQDNRRYFEGMMWLARTGAQWRHLPDDYGIPKVRSELGYSTRKTPRSCEAR
jgi:transposase